MVDQADSLKLENLVHVQYNKEQSCGSLCTRRRLIIRTMIPLHQFRIHASGSICKIINEYLVICLTKKKKKQEFTAEWRETGSTGPEEIKNCNQMEHHNINRSLSILRAHWDAIFPDFIFKSCLTTRTWDKHFTLWKQRIFQETEMSNLSNYHNWI